MDYRLKEVARPRGERYLVIATSGGWHTFWVHGSRYRYTLYVGGGSESEPVYRVERRFRAALEVLLYAHYLASKMDDEP